MATTTTRVKDIPTTATTAASDDYFVIDGATNGTRKYNHNADPAAHGLPSGNATSFATVTTSSPANGYYLSNSGSWVSSTDWRTVTFVPEPGKAYYATGSVRPTATALVCYFNSSNVLLGTHGIGPNTGAVVTYTKAPLTIPANTAKVAVVAYKDSPSPSVHYTATEAQIQVAGKADINPLLGKKIWWCGTSIPAGVTGRKYPEAVAELLGARVFNVALGSSMARRSTRTGNYAGCVWANLSGCLSKTQAEAEALITNWTTIRPTLVDGSSYTDTMSDADKERVRSSSFERVLLPYLNGTLEMPDLFVFDHGHNDYKYTLADGTTSDLDLAPTEANISAGTLAEDTTMTANSNAVLESFMGSLANVSSGSKASLIASWNRNCFRGAINFLCTLILKWNPRAKIVFVSEYEHSSSYSIVSTTQQLIADEWNRTLIRVDQKLGLSQRIIPGTRAYWGGAGNDLTELAINCPDGVHPHSDTTGETINRYARSIAAALRNLP